MLKLSKDVIKEQWPKWNWEDHKPEMNNTESKRFYNGPIIMNELRYGCLQGLLGN